MESAGTLLQWSSSNSTPAIVPSASCSSFSVRPGMMDDFPFSLEDLPPEIRDKIDDIIEKNEDLESQLDAIDALLFANRPAVKLDTNSKFDPGNESGIGSDSDSGHGVIPASDLLSTSHNSSLASMPQINLIENAQNVGPLLRTPAFNDEVDDFISRIIVPSPQHLTGSATSSVRQPSPSKGITFTTQSSHAVGYHPSTTSASASTAPKTRSGIFEGNLLSHLPPPPLEFGESSQKLIQGPESSPSDELIKAVSTNQNFLVTADVPRGHQSNVGSPKDSSCSSVTAVHVGKRESELPVKATSVPVSKSVLRQSDSTPEFNAGRSSQLYAWNKVTDQNSFPKFPPDKPTKPDKSLTLPNKLQRPSELNPSKDKQQGFWKKGKEKDMGSAQISTPSRYNQVAFGPTVNLRRKKWRPASEVLSGGGKSGSLDGGSGVNGSLKKKVSNAEDKDGKSAASDDDFSSLVLKQLKNGKPAQNSNIDRRTLKAQSMLSLYDPSIDFEGPYQEKKTTERKAKEKAKIDPFAFFRGKNRKHPTDGRERPSSEHLEALNRSASKKSEMDPQRSDYLFSVSQPLSSLTDIPRPSLHALMDHRSRSIREMRSPPPPGDISEILRIDVRDLEVGDLRPPAATFDTFLGEVRPIKWVEERTKFPVSNRWSHKTTEEIESFRNNHSRLSSAVAAKCSLPTNLSQVDKTDGGTAKSAMSKKGVQQQQHPSQPQSLSPANKSDHVNQSAARVDPGRRSSPHVPVAKGDSTPAKKVTTPKIVTSAPQLTKVMTPAAPPVIKTKNPSATASGTRMSIASACFSNLLLEDCKASGSRNVSRQNSSVKPVFVPHPQNQHLTSSSSNLRLNVTEDAAGRHNPRHSIAESRKLQEPQSRISQLPSASIQNPISNPAKVDVDPISWNGLDELFVLQTTYEGETAGGRATDDIRRMLSSLETQRNWLLSAGPTSSSSSSELFRGRKDSLATHSRRLVTEAKLMVSAATRSRHELTSTLTPVIHTVARVFESCRLVLAVLPSVISRTTLLDQVFEMGNVFLETLTSANLAAGRGHEDPTMEQLMTHTTALAQALHRLLNTTRSLDYRA